MPSLFIGLSEIGDNGWPDSWQTLTILWLKAFDIVSLNLFKP